MRNSGVVVWLDASVETLKQRIGGDTATSRTRPALHGGSSVDEVEDVMRKRERLYREAAHIQVSTEGSTIEDVVRSVLSALDGFRTAEGTELP